MRRRDAEQTTRLTRTGACALARTDWGDSVVHSHDQHPKAHSRKSTHGGHKHPADAKFFEEVAAALSGTHEILIIGPAAAKQEVANFLKEKHAALGKGIVAVETADHPSDAEVLSYARRHFKALDRMYKPDIGGSGTITSA